MTNFPFQRRVQDWMMECFSMEVCRDHIERNHRFLEEALELVQACGCTASEAHQLVDYVYGRPVGEPTQEIGGVMVTLAALCLANDYDMHEAGETELARVWTKIDQIRAKQAAKPKHSPLPAAPAHDSKTDAGEVERVADAIRKSNAYWWDRPDEPEDGIAETLAKVAIAALRAPAHSSDAIERLDVTDDDPLVVLVAHAIAEHGIGRPWDDFLPVNVHDVDQGDLIEYGRAAVAALRSTPVPQCDAGSAELIAETIWRAEYLRATGRQREVDWCDGVSWADKERYRFVAGAIIASGANLAPPAPVGAQEALEITDAMINAGARELWNDRDARHGGLWDTHDPREVCVIQTKATMKAALRAALSQPRTTDGAVRDDLGIVLSALRHFEEIVGEKYDDEGGIVAQIERDRTAPTLAAGSAEAPGEADLARIFLGIVVADRKGEGDVFDAAREFLATYDVTVRALAHPSANRGGEA